MADTTDFYLTEDDNEVLLKGNLNKTDWIVYVRLRSPLPSDSNPSSQSLNRA